MIPQETKDRILDLTKVEEVIGGLRLSKETGRQLSRLLPFPQREDSFVFGKPLQRASITASAATRGGSAVTFLMEHEGMSYVEGSALPWQTSTMWKLWREEEDPDVILSRQRKESLYLVTEFAAKFFG